MSISPERYCLGGLMKDIEKDLSAGDCDNSNDMTTYKSSQDKIFSSNDSYFTHQKKMILKMTKKMSLNSVKKIF